MLPKDKQKYFIVLPILILVIFSIVSPFLSINQNTINKNPSSAENTDSSSKTDAHIATMAPSASIESSANICKYIARETNNQIGIFSPDNADTPLFVIETSVKSLPEKDQLLLSYGISLTSDEELQRLIEDYSS